MLGFFPNNYISTKKIFCFVFFFFLRRKERKRKRKRFEKRFLKKEGLNSERIFSECKPQRRREMLFNTLLLSICAYFISIVGQSFVEIAVFWSESREDATEWVQWFQLARIAAFVDPLFNPLLVALRVPVMSAEVID